jgi:hypothetical protein
MKRLNLLVMLVALLALGLVFASCDSGTSNDDDYHLEWGTIQTTYFVVQNVIETQEWDVTPVGSSSAYATGATAVAIRDYNHKNTYFQAGGDEDGSFEELLEYKNDGIGLPQNLKTALAGQKSNVPLAGIFDAGAFAVLFYVSKK